MTYLFVVLCGFYVCMTVHFCCLTNFVQNVPMEHLESIVSGSVTASWPVKCAINQQGNVTLAAVLHLLDLTAKSVSFWLFSLCIK